LDQLFNVLTDQQREFGLLQSLIDLFISVKTSVDGTNEKVTAVQPCTGQFYAWITNVCGGVNRESN
jgi:hypothetical protein